jgi:hypothetical protein
MGIKKTALEMISLADIFNLEKNIFPPVSKKFYTKIFVVSKGCQSPALYTAF